jgi:ribose/xylose/arabinose/galactoside ABC-type transport system permease subunit
MAQSLNSDVATSRPGRVSSALWRFGQSEYLVLWLSMIYVAALAPFTPGFLSPENFGNVLVALLPLFLVGLGQTFVLITGGIDLSVTSVIGLASVVGAMVMNDRSGWLAGHPLAPAVAVLAMLTIGALVGLLNGLAITRLRMPAFIVTLTGMMFFSGLAIWFTQSKNIGGLPSSFLVLGSNPWMAFVIVSAVGGFAHLMLTRSLLGRWLYAVGHNPRAAHVSGVPVRGVTITAYVSCGVCAALAAVLYTGQAETGSPVLGQRILLDVIGATILGGTSLFGGKGKVLWTLCGVLFLKLVDNSLNLLSFSIFTITMVKGGLILFAAMLDVTRHRIGAGRT